MKSSSKLKKKMFMYLKKKNYSPCHSMGEKEFFELSFVKIKLIVFEIQWNIKMELSKKDQTEHNTLLRLGTQSVKNKVKYYFL